MERFPYAEHLNVEEVDYELLIRSELDEKVAVLDLVGKQRRLRMLFKSDGKNMRNYPSPYTITDEYDHIRGRVGDLVKAFEKNGPEPRYASRLLHYYYRAKRCLAEGENEVKLKRGLVRQVEDCMKQYKVGPPASPIIEKINDMLNVADTGRLGAQGQSEECNERKTPGGDTLKTTGAIPKVPKPVPTPSPKPTPWPMPTPMPMPTPTPKPAPIPLIPDAERSIHTEVQHRMEHLERMLESVTALLAKREQQEQPPAKKETAGHSRP